MKIAAFFAAVIVCLSACSASEYKTPACADVTSAVMSQIELPSAAEKTADNIGAYYDIDTSKITDMSVFVCASGAYPDEIAVFAFTDADSAATGLDAVNKRLSELTETFTDYTPEEMYKLENPVIKQYGNYVVFCDLSDNTKAAEIIENTFKN
jgi:hypothetical protein